VTVRIVDAHVHVWDATAFPIPWLRDGMGLPAVASPADYRAAAETCGIVSAVAVQVADSVAEARWLSAVTDADVVLSGAVLQYEPAPGRAFGATADGGARFAGIRAAVPQRADDLSDVPGLDDLAAALGASGRVLELLIRPEQLGGAAALAERHPSTPVVICHLGLGFADATDEWVAGLGALAAQPNAHAKFSGLVSPSRTDAHLSHLADIALAAFGPERLMFGSDWPLSARVADYPRLLTRVRRAVPDAAGAAFWHGTADRLYGLRA